MDHGSGKRGCHRTKQIRAGGGVALHGCKRRNADPLLSARRRRVRGLLLSFRIAAREAGPESIAAGRAGFARSGILDSGLATLVAPRNGDSAAPARAS